VVALAAVALALERALEVLVTHLPCLQARETQVVPGMPMSLIMGLAAAAEVAVQAQRVAPRLAVMVVLRPHLL
jgi:hypothetical protein